MASILKAGIFANLLTKRLNPIRLNAAKRMMCESSRSSFENKIEQQQNLNLVKPTEREKLSLVAAKMYKSVEEVPEFVSRTQIQTAREWYRVRISIWLAVGAAVSCATVVLIGRRQRRLMTLDHAKKVKEQNAEA